VGDGRFILATFRQVLHVGLCPDQPEGRIIEVVVVDRVQVGKTQCDPQETGTAVKQVIDGAKPDVRLTGILYLDVTDHPARCSRPLADAV
jgi:hypothetical protein